MTETTHTEETNLTHHEDDDTSRKASAEAKRYRLRLRETEAKLEAATARLESLERAEVERIAAELGLVKPQAIWAAGLDLNTLHDDEGNIDTELAHELVKSTADEFGLAAHPVIQTNPAQSPDAQTVDTETNPWHEAFKP
jgi:division protein CdvB (Snf7/Vps24/ESCRT-III family)